ncbi:MAG: BatA domain-containing protein [Opitutales bacterium]
MSFLTPLFLLGGLAIAGPILFHLIRRNTRERFTFSSLMFLRPEPPRVTRKSRLEDLILLLARCALLAALTLAFARPFVKQLVTPDPSSEAGHRTALLIDVSASMRRDGLWEKTLAKAREVIEETQATGSLSILTFGTETTPLLRFDQWNAIPEEQRVAFALQALATLEPGWGGTHLGNALLTASEILDESDSSQPQRIIAVTDQQEGSRLDGIQGHQWPEHAQVEIVVVAPRSVGNAGLHLAPRREDDQNASGRLRVRVVNSEDATREKFQLAWVQPNDANATGLTHLYLPPGQSRSLTAPPRPMGNNWSLALYGDDETFDNQLFIVPETPEPVRIHYLGKEKPDDVDGMLFYLKRAFSQTRLQKVEVLDHAPDELAGQLIHPDDRLLVVTEPLPDEALAEARGFCESGHPVLLVLRDASLGNTLSSLAASGPLPVTEEKLKDYALLTQMDFEHPLLVPFGEPRFSDFTKIHFWKHRRLDASRLPGARILAHFDDGAPALLDLPLGRGRLLVLTAGWHPADSQLALSSKFVPLLYSIIELGQGKEPVKAENWVGQPISLPVEGEIARKLTGPQGLLELDPDRDVFYAEDPGIYKLSGDETSIFAVNLPPAESHTAPLPEELFEGLQLPLSPKTQEEVELAMTQRQTMIDEELEQQQKGWRWLIMGAIALAILETWLGGRTWRRPATTGETREAT